MGIGSGSFSISASGTDSHAFDLSMFEGSGTQALGVQFFSGWRHRNDERSVRDADL
jgi:hypothetical protein